MWRYRFLLLYPLLLLTARAGDRIIFPHQFHLEVMELECAECHARVSESNSIPPRLLPAMEVCTACHDGDTAAEDCEVCHTDPEDPLPLAESRPPSGLAFSHHLHLRQQPRCSTCHEYINSDDGTLPFRQWDPAGCRTCHQSTAPASHTLDWSRAHGVGMTGNNRDGCRLCHSQATCDGCHQIQGFEPRVHAVDFILAHGFEARNAVLECSTCHDLAVSCRGCHRTNGIMPLDHSRIDWTGGNGGTHATAAMDEPEVCQACHDPAGDNTCRRCH